MTFTIHDACILDYTVNCEKHWILIRTEYRDQGQPFQRIDARFEGVIGYKLLDGLNGVLFNIEEESLERVLEEHQVDFDWGRNYGWPWTNAGSVSAKEYIESKNCKVFRLQGQNCFDGFIIAKSMSIETSK